MRKTGVNVLRSLVVIAAVMTLIASPRIGPPEGVAAAADPRQVFFVSYGGVYQDAMTKAWLEPYAKQNGVQVIQDVNYETAKLRAQVDAGLVTWDLVDLDPSFGIGDRDAKYLEPLDYTIIDRTKLLSGFSDTYRVAYLITGNILAYNTKLLGPGKIPENWSEFFDVAKFPGKRCIPKFVSGRQLEIALLASGVAPDQLYPLDVPRALKKLDTIRDKLLFWESGAQLQQLLTDGEAVMCLAWNGRAYAARRAGTPIAIQWNQQILSASWFGVAKGAPHKAEAMKLIAYMVSSEPQGRFTTYLPYGLTNREAKPDPASIPDLPTSHLGTAIRYDYAWWSANSRSALVKWQEWLQK